MRIQKIKNAIKTKAFAAPIHEGKIIQTDAIKRKVKSLFLLVFNERKKTAK